MTRSDDVCSRTTNKPQKIEEQRKLWVQMDGRNRIFFPLNRKPCLILEGNKGEETDLYIVVLARFKADIQGAFFWFISS
ncbi:MAG: hypothetical protein WBZ36_13635 [Candidatus Nitrosopolaris sp.]